MQNPLSHGKMTIIGCRFQPLLRERYKIRAEPGDENYEDIMTRIRNYRIIVARRAKMAQLNYILIK